MAGHISYNPPEHPHVCEPGIVRRWNGRKAKAEANIGAHWTCHLCFSIWELTDRGWEQTMLMGMP